MAESSDPKRNPRDGDLEPRARRTIRTRQATIQYSADDVAESLGRADESEDESENDVPQPEVESRERDKSPLPPLTPISTGVSGDRRTGTMPLAALLPALGELSSLHASRQSLERRLRTLHGESSLTDDDEGKGRMSEESMLNHVLQWLSLGEEE